MSISPLLPLWLFEATLRGSACILLVWLLRPLFLRWAGARATHLLWLIVLVQFLVPWLPDAPVSPFTAPAVAAAPAPSSFAGAKVVVTVGDAPAQRIVAATVPAAPATPAPVFWLLPLWVVGATGIGALAVLRAIRAARLVRRAPEISSHPLVRAALAELPHVPRRLRIRETAELRSPAVCGVLRPTILLPVQWWEQLTSEEFRCVLLHEIGHIRRADLLWRWAFLIAQAVHWFNPLVWLAGRSARADQELACDEWVLAQTDSVDGELYGEVLLKAASLLGVARLTSPVHATMAESKAGLTFRIRHLARIRPHGWMAFSMVLVVAAAAIFLIAPPSQAQSAEGTPLKATDPAVPAAPPETTAPAPKSPDQPAPMQVEIEAKFVEITEGDLPALTPDGVAEQSTTSPTPPPGTDAAIDALLFGSPASNRAGLTSLFTDPQFQVVVRALNQKSGVDLLSAPRVTTKSGQRAVIEIIREFRYPTEFTDQDENSLVSPKSFETRNTGVTLDVEPVVTPDGRIELVLIPQVVEFLGFVNYRAGRPARPPGSKDAMADLLEPMKSARVINQPIFGTRKITTTVLMDSGQTVLVGAMGRSDEQVQERGFMERIQRPAVLEPALTKIVPRSLYIFVTARLINPSGEAISSPAADPKPRTPEKTVIVQSDKPAAPSPPADGASLPGVPVPGKAGFVTSPYSPKAGYIDVRGFPPGTQVKCPYSGKMFLVP